MSEDRVAILEAQVAELKAAVEALWSAVNNDSAIHSIVARIELYTTEHEQRMAAVTEALKQKIDGLVARYRKELFDGFNKSVAEVAASKVTVDLVAASLSKTLRSQVLITRNATAAEIKDKSNNVLVVRNATREESKQ